MMPVDLETRVRNVASTLKFPPTPDIAGRLSSRLQPSPLSSHWRKRLAWSLGVILVLAVSLLLIPPARAAMVAFIRIGVDRIFYRAETPAPLPSRTPNLAGAISGLVTETALAVTQTPGPILQDLIGETDLAHARAQAPYEIRLPAYPSDLGPPDHVFVQDANGVMAILVWVDHKQPTHVVMSLHFVPNGSWAIDKFSPLVIQQTQVDGRRAIWAEGPYPLILRNGDVEFTRLIEGNVLIWTDQGVTYRLETGGSMDEAVKIAESLQALP